MFKGCGVGCDWAEDGTEAENDFSSSIESLFGRDGARFNGVGGGTRSSRRSGGFWRVSSFLMAFSLSRLASLLIQGWTGAFALEYEAGTRGAIGAGVVT